MELECIPGWAFYLWCWFVVFVVGAIFLYAWGCDDE